MRWVKSFQSLIWCFNSDFPRRHLSSYTETTETKTQSVSWGTLLQVWERCHMIEDMELEWLSSVFEALSYTLCNVNSCKYLWLILISLLTITDLLVLLILALIHNRVPKVSRNVHLCLFYGHCRLLHYGAKVRSDICVKNPHFSSLSSHGLYYTPLHDFFNIECWNVECGSCSQRADLSCTGLQLHHPAASHELQ